MTALSKAHSKKSGITISDLKTLIDVLKHDNQASLQHCGKDRTKHKCQIMDQVSLANRNLHLPEWQSKLEKWIRIKDDHHHKGRVCITFHNNPLRPKTYSVGEIQQLLLSFFWANTENVEFATISHLKQIENVCVYVLEDEKLAQRFKVAFGENFEHVLKYNCCDDWSYSLCHITKYREEIIKGREKVYIEKNGTRYNRKKVLLSSVQMKKNNFSNVDQLYYEQDEPSLPMFAVDCKMCLTEDGEQLARVSVVDEDLNTLLDEYVIPQKPVIDYMTESTGITEEMLNKATWSMENVQTWFQNLSFPDEIILVGHSLASSLQEMETDRSFVIDTSILYDLPEHENSKSLLKKLAWDLMHLKIRNNVGGVGLCSVESAKAAMLLTQTKLGGIRLKEHLRSRANHQVVFFDYSQAHQLKKFVSFHSKYFKSINNSIGTSLTQKRTICAIICQNELYLKITS